MVRRTPLSVAEKLAAPALGARTVARMMHRRPCLQTMPEAPMSLGVERALVFQAIEGSDEAPLNGNSALVEVNGGGYREFRVSPDSLGLSQATKMHTP